MKFLDVPKSGSVANQTYAHNRFGQYVRARVGRGGTPLVPLTDADAAWQALTIDQQRGWNEWSDLIRRRDRLGQEKILSGFQRFVGAWCLADRVSATVTDAPAERSSFVASSLMLSTTSSDTVKAELFTENSGGYAWWEVAFPSSSLGTNSPPGRGAYWKFLTATEVAVPTSPVTALWTVPFLTGARRAFVRARVVGYDWIVGPWLVAGPLEVTP